MRKIVAILILATILSTVFIVSSVFIVQAHAYATYLDRQGDSWSMEVYVNSSNIINPSKCLDRVVLSAITPKPGAFRSVSILLSGWTYTTDGESYLNLTAPKPINTTGDYYIGNFRSVYNGTSDYNQFTWKGIGADGTTVGSGNVLFLTQVGGIWVPVDKLALLAPYIALASTILAATATTAIYVKRRKKQ